MPSPARKPLSAKQKDSLSLMLYRTEVTLYEMSTGEYTCDPVFNRPKEFWEAQNHAANCYTDSSLDGCGSPTLHAYCDLASVIFAV